MDVVSEVLSGNKRLLSLTHFLGKEVLRQDNQGIQERLSVINVAYTTFKHRS